MGMYPVLLLARKEEVAASGNANEDIQTPAEKQFAHLQPHALGALMLHKQVPAYPLHDTGHIFIFLLFSSRLRDDIRHTCRFDSGCC